VRAALSAPAVPSTQAELLARAQSLAGHTVAEIAAKAGREVPADLRRAKGFIGHLAEWATGAPGGSTAGPDFAKLGIELKTIPVSVAGRPTESTFVCTIDLRQITRTEWESSALRRKLAHVLWIPIESNAHVPLGARRFGQPLLWQPSDEDQAVLRADWEELVELIGRDDIDRVNARAGRYLQVRPKAANSRQRTRALDRDDVPIRALPRGFYLRRVFTERIFARAAVA